MSQLLKQIALLFHTVVLKFIYRQKFSRKVTYHLTQIKLTMPFCVSYRQKMGKAKNKLRCLDVCLKWLQLTGGADTSLAQPGRKQAAPVKSVMGREMDW